MNYTNNICHKLLWAVALLSVATGCTRDIDSDVIATFPNQSDVFMDEFSSDLQYQAWGKVTNFDIDTETKFDGTSAMRIEVPNPNDPEGSWAGGTFYSSMGRNLSGYDALTFYAKASVSTEVEVGIGNYGNVEYLVKVTGVKLNTNWTKIIIPIPNSAKLLSEQGLFYYSAGAVNDEGYTIWFDNVRFEKLGTLAHPHIESKEIPGFPGKLNIGMLVETINLPNGVNRRMEVSPNYFTYESSNTEVASVKNGAINIRKKGEAVISLKEAEGEIKVNCFDFAPTPNKAANNVISLYSDSYASKINANWNPRWEWSTAEYNEIEASTDQHVGHYSGLNFVGIVFDKPTNCVDMSHLHIDLLSMDRVSAQSEISISIFYGANEVKHIINKTNHPDFQSKQWLSIDLPLQTDDTKIIPQLAVACDDNTRNLLVDNIYFYKN